MRFDGEGDWVLVTQVAGDGGADEYGVRGGFDE